MEWHVVAVLQAIATTYFGIHQVTMGTKLYIDHNLCKVGWLFYILSKLVPVNYCCHYLCNNSQHQLHFRAVIGFILFSQLLSSLHTDASGFISFPPTITSLTEEY